MKIAFVSHSFGQYCIQLANALARDNEVLLVLEHKEASPRLAELDPNVELHSFRAPRLRQALRQIYSNHGLIRRIAQFKPDVVHLQGGYLWFNLLLPLLRRYPLVVTAHDVRHHPGDRASKKNCQTLLDMGYRRADQLIVHGNRLKQMVVDELRIPGHNVHVIPHVAIGPRDLKTTSPENNHEILFFGRIWDYKGLEYLIRAEPLITAKVPQARIVIAGRGESLDRYRQMMVDQDRFIVHNEWISDERRVEFFERAAVVALPYVEASQSGVIPVAYSHARPVVATTVGSLPEMVEDGRTGYLVPPRNEHALAEAIVRLMLDGKLRQRMGENGKQFLDTHCSPEKIAAMTLDVYAQAIARPRCSH